VETSFRKLQPIRSNSNIFKKMKFGKYSYK
jgi:hypothetical protein